MGRVVCVRGAGAVGVARDELLALLAFVVHRVAQRARHRREEEHETTAKDEDAAGKIEPFAARDLWEESISLRTVVCFVVSLFARGRARRVVVPAGSCSTHYHQKKDEDEPHNHAIFAYMRLVEELGLTGIRFFAVICAFR